MQRCRQTPAVARHQFVVFAKQQEGVYQGAAPRDFTSFGAVAGMVLQEQQEGIQRVLLASAEKMGGGFRFECFR